MTKFQVEFEFVNNDTSYTNNLNILTDKETRHLHLEEKSQKQTYNKILI